jgi:hypothetical protein
MTGAVTLIADNMTIYENVLNPLAIQTSGILTVKPRTATQAIRLNVGDGYTSVSDPDFVATGGSDFRINAKNFFDAINTSTISPSKVVIGSNVGTGAVVIGANWNASAYNFPIEVWGNGITASGAITTANDISLLSTSASLASGYASINAGAYTVTLGRAGAWSYDTSTLDTTFTNVTSGGRGLTTTTAGDLTLTGTYADIGSRNYIFGAISGDVILSSLTMAKTTGGTQGIILRASNSITTSGTNSITSGTGALHIRLNSDSDNSAAGAISLSSTTLTSNGGNISLGGGDATSNSQTLSQFNNASLSMLDYAESGAGASVRGVYQNGGSINAGGGNISILGRSTGTGDENHGVQLSGIMSTSGAGTITATGVGSSNGTSYNNGINTYASTITVVDGALTFNGTGAGTNAWNSGISSVSISNGSGSATINSTGIGAIYLTGQGTTQNASGQLNTGINVTRINAVNGDVTFNGTGGGGTTSPGSNVGIYGGNITTTGAGSIIVTGLGGRNAHGIAGGFYISGTGNITLTGTATFAESGIFAVGTISTGGNGNITLTGTSPSGTGVKLNAAYASFRYVQVSNGNIIINGTGGNFGIGFDTEIYENNAILRSTGSGNITLTGTGTTRDIDLTTGNPAYIYNFGNSAMTGNIRINADTGFGDIAYLNFLTQGQVIFAPRTTTNSIGLNGGAGVVSMPNSLLGYISTSTLPSKVVFGDSVAGTGLATIGSGWDVSSYTFPIEVWGGSVTNTGTITGSTADLSLYARTGAITLNTNANISTAGNILLSAQCSTSNITQNSGAHIATSGAGKTITLRADNTILANANFTSQGGAITLNSDRDASTAGAISLTSTTLTSNGGNITLGGGSDPATGYAWGTAS